MKSMKLKLIESFSAIALLFASGSVVGKESSLTLAGETAVAFDTDGVPLVRASREYLLMWAENSAGQIYEIDNQQQRVRITPDARDALWLSCADLVQPVCGSPQPNQNRTLPNPDDYPADRGALPLCPGDPRCPK